jgi:DNA-binding LytR/AlgR family response regulator
MKVLIIEDEPRAAGRLEKLICTLIPKAEILGKIESVREAVVFLPEHPETELIFADIQLADGLSFEIFKQVRVRCPIIFTTAYDHYAIEAFNTNGIDYLLKPIEEERLSQAIAKLKSLTGQPNLEALYALIHEKSLSKKKFKNRFMVKVGEQIKAIDTQNIRAFFSFDGATFLLTSTLNNYIVDYTLDQLEEMLDPEIFFRVNRKHLLSLSSCKQIYSWSGSRLVVEVDGFDEKVIVARERVSAFKTWLGQ